MLFCGSTDVLFHNSGPGSCINVKVFWGVNTIVLCSLVNANACNQVTNVKAL